MSDAAITVLVAGLGQVVVLVIGFLTLWVKLKYGVEPKIDSNTALTKAGTASATINAKIAATAATTAATKADEVARQMNGALEERVTLIVKTYVDPLLIALRMRGEQDDNDMKEVRDALQEFVKEGELKAFSEYVHQRNHDLLNAMNKQSTTMAVLVEELKKARS